MTFHWIGGPNNGGTSRALSGRAVRRKKEKTLGPATMPKHEAQQKLADYIEEYTGKLIHQGESIESFAELWKASRP
jgi:hypothetical protein